MACLFSLSEAAVTPAVLRTGCDENNDLVVSWLPAVLLMRMIGFRCDNDDINDMIMMILIMI